MAGILFFIISLAATLAGVFVYRRWSISRGVLAAPNDRSSHDVPTPSGAGIIIAAISIAAYGIASFLLVGGLPIAYIGAAAMIAIIGWLDDLFEVSFLLRLAVQIAAAVLIIASLGPIRTVGAGGNLALDLGVAGYFFTVLWIVSLVNGYNFMDGIDGMAGLQAFIAATAWFMLPLTSGAAIILAAALAGSALGFLVFNWQPAKIFLGDAGSGFLGFTFAVMPLLAAGSAQPTWQKANLAYAAVIFVWLFVFDSFTTSIKRIWRGQKLWIGQREHLYQRLVLAGYSHAFVTVLYGALTLLVIMLFFGFYRSTAALALVPLIFAAVIGVALTIFVSRLKDLI